jgi:Tol biopolymer transport system component
MNVLYKIPTLGGSMQRLVADVDSPVTLSPDGTQLAFVRNSDEKQNSVLIVANEDGSGERQIAERKYSEYLMSVAWSPGKGTIAALARQFDATFKLVEIPITGGPERLVGTDNWHGATAGLTWTSNGEGLIFAGQYQPGRPFEILYVSPEKGEVRKITNGLDDLYLGVTVSDDSRSLASVRGVSSRDLWLGRCDDSNSFRPITTGGVSSLGTWTPDGRILYANNAGGNSAWVMNGDGSGATRLGPSSEYAVNQFRMSPNGRYIVFTSWKSGDPHLWRMDADGGNPRPLTNSNYSPSTTEELGADYSPDGAWVIYGKSRLLPSNGAPITRST